MNTVTFTKEKDNVSYDSYSDLSIVLNSKEISAPSPKVETINITGGDGVLDFTEYFGEVKYNNRNIKLNFTSLVKNDFLSHFSLLQNMLHGQRFKITFSDDPDFYYVGRISLDAWKSNKNICTFTATIDCQPYKLKQNVTVVSKTITENTIFSLENLQKKVVPTVTTSGAATLIWGNSTYTLSEGTYTLPGILLEKGMNSIEVQVTASTTITFSYQEGEL
jgi:phage-related protein